MSKNNKINGAENWANPDKNNDPQQSNSLFHPIVICILTFVVLLGTILGGWILYKFVQYCRETPEDLENPSTIHLTDDNTSSSEREPTSIFHILEEHGNTILSTFPPSYTPQYDAPPLNQDGAPPPYKSHESLVETIGGQHEYSTLQFNV